MVPKQGANMPLPASFTPIRKVGKQRQRLSHQQEYVGEVRDLRTKGRKMAKRDLKEKKGRRGLRHRMVVQRGEQIE